MTRMTLHTRDGDAVEALFGPALTAEGGPDPQARLQPTLLFFHGNGGDLRDTFGEVQKLRRLDVNVMAPDYVGYGVNTATPTEQGCYQAADAAYDALMARPDIDRSRVVILGHSLGTAVAVDLAARTLRAHRPLAGLAVVSGFTSMPDEGHTQYPIYPIFLLRLAARYKFESARKMADVTCPVFIAHSRSDQLIPFAMAGQLAAACPGPVTRLTFDHVPHGYAFSTGASQVFPALSAFVRHAAASK
jgi:pimeloyl-ACP methyl ester carboxylesterase